MATERCGKHWASWAVGRLAGVCLTLVLLGVASGCGPSTDEPAGASGAPPADRLEIRQPRVLLTPGMGAAYFSVLNPGSQSDRLLRVETSAARASETHESLAVDGVMRMEPRPDGFEVPAGGTLELKPGGKHVMLVEPRPMAGAAAEIPLILHFERAGAIEVRAKLLDPAAEGS